jgi:hypothetical protein
VCGCALCATNAVPVRRVAAAALHCIAGQAVALIAGQAVAPGGVMHDVMV